MFYKISKDIYYRPHEPARDRPNIGYVVGRDKSLLIDVGASEAHVQDIMKDLAQQGLPIANYGCITHKDWDHAYGAWGAKKHGIALIAGHRTNAELLEICKKWSWTVEAMSDRVEKGIELDFCNQMMLKEYPNRDIKVIPADIIVDQKMTLDLGGVVCEIYSVPNPHTQECLIVRYKDFVFLSDSPNLDLYQKKWEYDETKGFRESIKSLTYDKVRLQQYLDFLKPLQFSACIGGHDNLKTKAELLAQLEGYLI